MRVEWRNPRLNANRLIFEFFLGEQLYDARNLLATPPPQESTTPAEASLLGEIPPPDAPSAGTRWLIVMDVSHGGDALLTEPTLDALINLAGQRIGVETGAVRALLVDATLAKPGLLPVGSRVALTTAPELLALP